VLLDITYSDPDLKPLANVATSEWAKEDNLKLVLRQGRLRDDFWALGLPEPQDVQSVSLVDNEYLCVRVKVTCDPSLVDFSVSAFLGISIT